jgi:hypothetical protein
MIDEPSNPRQTHRPVPPIAIEAVAMISASGIDKALHVVFSS